MVARPSQQPARPFSRLAPLALALSVFLTAPAAAWGPQAHRVIARVAETRLSTIASDNVAWLLGGERLADVAIWADAHRSDHPETAAWHYVNIPLEATGYDRDRDCQGLKRGPRVRGDCVVDQIRENEARLSDTSLARAERATALRFLVHLVADLHQPFHAIGVDRGGNDIRVRLFGSTACAPGTSARTPCTLHAAWDGALIARRRWSDTRYLEALAPRIAGVRSRALIDAPPDTWATESFVAAKAALVRPGANLDAAYYDRAMDVIDARLALGGLRLAALLNRSLTNRARVP